MNGGATALMMTLGEAAAALGARLSGVDSGFSRAISDSRTVQHGDLFVALKGERFDGHNFVQRQPNWAPPACSLRAHCLISSFPRLWFPIPA